MTCRDPKRFIGSASVSYREIRTNGVRNKIRIPCKIVNNEFKNGNTV